jgi:hypothetical protein
LLEILQRIAQGLNHAIALDEGSALVVVGIKAVSAAPIRKCRKAERQ